MDYKKEYDEMVQRVKELHKAGNTLTKKQMEIICPALAESEDERIRKELIDALKASETVGELKFILPEPTREECIAYLEKQKEQKHPDGCFTCNEYKKGYEEGRRNGFTAGYNKAIKEVEQNEQKPDELDGKALLHVSNKSYDIGFRDGVASVKPAEWKPQPESLEALMYAIEGKWEMIKPTSYLSRKLEDLYEGLVNTFNVNETFLAELPKTTYTAKDIEELKKLKDKIDASMDEKPSEYGDDVIEEAEEYISKVACGEYGVEVTEAYIAGVLSERNRKPAEWSEEDERMRNQLIYDIEHHKKDGLISAKQNKATKALYNGIEKCYDEKIAWLKSLRPVSKESLQSWKPSEEQMEAMEYVIRDYREDGCNATANYLQEILDHLKNM